MTHTGLPLRSTLALMAMALAPAALAADLDVVLTPMAPPLSNGVTHATASSVSFDVTNSKAGTQIRRLDFALPAGYTGNGGVGPAGWVAVPVTTGTLSRIRFQVTSCSQAGLAANSTATFKLNATPPTTTALPGDTTDSLGSVTPSDPCGGPGGWTVPAQDSVTFPRRVLAISAAASVTSGTSPLTTSITFTVANKASVAKSGVSIQTPAVTASTGGTFTTSGCTSKQLNLAARGGTGDTATVTCTYQFSAPSKAGVEFTVASTASGSSATSTGATSPPIQVGPFVATFAFDTLKAGPGGRVVATLTVKNNSTATVFIALPTYDALTLRNLTRASGTANPPATTKFRSGWTLPFKYYFTVSTSASAIYSVSGQAQAFVTAGGASAGNTNTATTPAGTVSAPPIGITPAALVKARRAGTYPFTLTLTNPFPGNITAVRIVNPQNATWLKLADAGGSDLTAGTTKTSGTTDTLTYTGTVPSSSSATLKFRFTDIPAPAATTTYRFQVSVTAAGLSAQSYDLFVVDAVPPADVGSFAVLSTSGGQQLTWINSTRADAPHDGVVVFRTSAPTAPPVPADGSDYVGDPTAFYADSAQSAAQSYPDHAVGTFNYRICNRDPNLIYSSCNSGFWNNSGWLDSVVAPTGGWSHALGGQMLLLPGLIPGGRLGVVSNAPDVTLLDVATGAKAFPSVALSALPSTYSPILKLPSGMRLLFAADQYGGVTAVDVDTGAIAWSVSKPGEAFLAGVGGVEWQYAAPAFQSAYSGDVLFVGSAAGNLFALDAATGKTLWTVALGASMRAGLFYDSTWNHLVIPTDGGGIAALDLTGSTELGVPPTWAAGWINPGGSYTFRCFHGAQLICGTKTGGVRVLDRANGTVVASYEPDSSAASYFKLPPSNIWSYAGGVAISNAKAVLRFTVSGSAVTPAAAWVPGSTLSPMQLFQATSTIYLAGSDRKVHKLSLPTLTEVASVNVPSQAASSLLGPPVYDSTQNLFIFGTSDSHLWAVKAF